MSHPHELDWILPRATRIDVERSVLRPDVDSIVLGAAVSLLLVLLSGALWIVGIASSDDADPGSSKAVVVVTSR
ncbi:MAG: hypothetical protein ABIT01_07660 [Thermoanaerobaculia bacterium]